ncbi:phosphatase PAP2 family protein [Actinocatenispora rupis]|uniref:Phosphatidic acid phosphatase type 2/haloperoxidase domain-containing protein n=1 Tax=Actinocatenispora rupis TaxID=519421 RepID=A0A8J3J5V3_9ACTN|nr:phosphatase PAP2 family protein [Actinocatenispora rupis]GID12655.1 hypothetical protein Aru02nite_35440 [Actinocatenispora rupis]
MVRCRWLGGGTGVVLLAAFAGLGVWGRRGPLRVDVLVAWSVTGWRSPGLTGVVRGVNLVLAPVLGWVALGVLLLVAVWWLARRAWRRAGFVALVALGFVAVWRGVTEVKVLVGRPRPVSSGFLDRVSGFSYPSGHVAAVASVCALAVLLAVRWRRWRWPVVAVGVVATAVTCVDRVYLGVHWPTDVVGAVCGVAGCALVAGALWCCRTRG